MKVKTKAKTSKLSFYIKMANKYAEMYCNEPAMSKKGKRYLFLSTYYDWLITRVYLIQANKANSSEHRARAMRCINSAGRQMGQAYSNLKGA